MNFDTNVKDRFVGQGSECVNRPKHFFFLSIFGAWFPFILFPPFLFIFPFLHLIIALCGGVVCELARRLLRPSEFNFSLFLHPNPFSRVSLRRPQRARFLIFPRYAPFSPFKSSSFWSPPLFFYAPQSSSSPAPMAVRCRFLASGLLEQHRISWLWCWRLCCSALLVLSSWIGANLRMISKFTCIVEHFRV